MLSVNIQLQTHARCWSKLLTGVWKCIVIKSHPWRVLNCTAWLVTFTSKRDHITPILFQLDWLPIWNRSWCMILLCRYKVLDGPAPIRSPDLAQNSGKLLRSESDSTLHLWNELPEQVKLASKQRFVKPYYDTRYPFIRVIMLESKHAWLCSQCKVHQSS